jgi:NAD(P)-dependent dehydrogenase (short-subunit alcohol dehydrogenase family)
MLAKASIQSVSSHRSVNVFTTRIYEGTHLRVLRALCGDNLLLPQRPQRPKKGTPMPGMLEGKSALITGGGGGIGRAAALAFAREGARVAVADLMTDAAQETVAMVNRAGGQAISLTGDVTSTDHVQAMVAGVIASYGHLDCAFNNAGIAPWQVDASGMKTADWPEASFDRMIAVNLKSVWLCMKHEIPHMQAQGGGAIVNTSSILGLVGLANGTAYTAAKHGVIGLTKTAALEYAEDCIRVNAVCPGFIRTRMTADALEQRGEQIADRTPLGRVGDPAEIAELVVWLCSDRASYVTGAAYAVDGGWTAI